MKHTSRTDWKSGLAFEAHIDNHSLVMDANPEFGGTDLGPSPKKLLLAGLAGCTGMDVVALLNKMRMPFDSFSIEVEGDMTDEHPKVYRSLNIRFIFTGSDLDRDKIEKAVKLSEERYCGVSAMLSKAADISYEIILNS